METTRNLQLNFDSDIISDSKKELVDAFFTQVPSMSNPELLVYRAICLNNQVVGIKCRNNRGGLCVIEHFFIPWNYIHVWDGKNIYNCCCG